MRIIFLPRDGAYEVCGGGWGWGGESGRIVGRQQEGKEGTIKKVTT